MTDTQEEKKFNRDTNILNVSLNRGFTFYVFLAKKFFEDFDTVELHSLGAATSPAIQTAENLIRHEYATMHQIRTDTIDIERKDGQSQKKAKLFITLKKGKNFDAAIAEFEKVREERQAAHEQEKPSE